MALNDQAQTLFKGFSKLSRQERYQRLQQMGALTDDDVAYLSAGPQLAPELAEHFIENAIGYFHLPLGVATNFRIDSKDYVLPMAVEETSIIAALSKTAKWIREHGEINTAIFGNALIGQLQLTELTDFEQAKQIIEQNKTFLIEMANQDVAASMVKRGGGVTDLQVRELSHAGRPMLVLHVLVNTCDAMGANIINTICEFLKAPIENLLSAPVNLCILSNLTDTKLTRATVTLRGIDPELAEKIVGAADFAQADPYRACTHNKGVLNGMDPLLIATGNDWRALEAAVHAHAARDGQYRSITEWSYQNGELTGVLEAPITVGTVGGVTQLHPTAKLCLKLLEVQSADELSRVVASAGLVQNLGAMRALVTQGIIQGHMKLHLTNLSLSAGAEQSELPELRTKLEDLFHLQKRISLSATKKVLAELRDTKRSVKAAVKAALKATSID